MFLLVGFMFAFNLGKTTLSNVSGCMSFDDSMHWCHNGLSFLMYLHLKMNENM